MFCNDGFYLRKNMMQKPVLLLVEDSEDDAFFFGRAFEKAELPLTFQRAENGAQAVEILRRAATQKELLPRIIFLDLKMPVMNGFDVLAWMQTQTLPKIPVIILSGSDQPSDMDRAYQLGAAAYLVKPISVAELRRIVGVEPSGAGQPKAGSGAHS